MGPSCGHWSVAITWCMSLPSLARTPSMCRSTETRVPEAGRATRQKKLTVNAFTEHRTILTPISSHHCRLHVSEKWSFTVLSQRDFKGCLLQRLVLWALGVHTVVLLGRVLCLQAGKEDIHQSREVTTSCGSLVSQRGRLPQTRGQPTSPVT